MLARVSPSPVVELNRAVAVSMAEGPGAGPEAALVLVDALVAEGSLARYHLLPAVRADLLLRLDRPREARDELERAAGLTRNAREQALLRQRAAQCVPTDSATAEAASRRAGSLSADVPSR